MEQLDNSMKFVLELFYQISKKINVILARKFVTCYFGDI